MNSIGIFAPKEEKEEGNISTYSQYDNSDKYSYNLLVLKLNEINFGDKFNDFSTYPLLKECIRKNTMLVDLNLSKTQISSKELAGITNILTDMNVKWLDLSYNYLNNQKPYKEYN